MTSEARFQLAAPLVNLTDYWTDGTADRSLTEATLSAGSLSVSIGTTAASGNVAATNGVSINLSNLKGLVSGSASAKVPFLALPLAAEPLFTQAVVGSLTLRVKPPGTLFTSPLSATVNVSARTEAGVTKLLIEPTAPITHSTGLVTITYKTGTVIGQTYEEAGIPWLRLDFLTLLSSITKGTPLVQTALAEGQADFAIDFNGLPVVDGSGNAVQSLKASAVLSSGTTVIPNRPPEIYRDVTGDGRLLAAVAVEAGKSASLITSGSLKVFDANGVAEILVAEPEQGRLLLGTTPIDFTATDASIRSYGGRRWKVFSVSGGVAPTQLATLQFEADADALKGEETVVWLIARDTRQAYSSPFTALVTVSGPDRAPEWTVLPTLAELIDTNGDDIFVLLQGQLQARDPEGVALTYSVAQGQTQANLSVRVGLYGQISVVRASGAVRYQPNDALIEALGPGTFTDTFLLQASDGVNTVGQTVSIIVQGANDMPAGANSTLGVLENTFYPFALEDFGFSDRDSGDSLGAVRIETLPQAGAGVLTVAGTRVTAGQVIDAAQIIDLRFEPAANVNGLNAASFDFSVRDAQLFDASPNTFRVDIAASDWMRLSGQTYHWSSHVLLGDVDMAFQSTGLAVSQPVSTGPEGRFELTLPDEGMYRVEASRELTSGETGNVISAADALAALKLSVGLNPNADPDGAGPLKALPVSPYQFLAADVTGDGRVSAADALAILKMAVKRTDAPAREWLFVNEVHDVWDEMAGAGTGAFSLTRSNVSKDGVMPTDLELTKQAPLNLVAVLKGDVNGNWSAPAGSERLPDSYFHVLAAAHPLTVQVAQFGVMPM
jgi:VCBS repeat-containing protein